LLLGRDNNLDDNSPCNDSWSGNNFSTVVPTTTVLVTGLVPGPSLVSVTYTTAGPSAPTSAPSSLPPPVHDTDDADSGLDSEMITDSLNPPPFRVTTAEDAETWLDRFNDYCQWKAYDENKAGALFKVLLRDSATIWLQSLKPDMVNNWTNLQQAFKGRYMMASFLKYKHASKLFNKKQNNKSVDDFCVQMQHLAKQVNADEQTLQFAVLNGL